ncbi:MAG: efflux RND transporter permease subunit [Candidatus Eremiobacteraeota bacterium]|nr:efflux RND transporter permease subunit [Candidatus Eremiobacteraeota bacterium]MBV8367174.1 efflux RND transporter permease subunit [Candidatus Eremiobacteraeota bacterium]
MWLTRFAIRQPTVVTLFFLAVAVFGIIGFFEMGVNVNPPVTLPAVIVYAPYSGASPEEIERLVIRPIEDQLQNVRHVDRIFARAQEGSGFISVQLKLGANVDFAATDVQQAVDAARINLPTDLDPPVVSKEDPNAQPILSEYLTSKKLSPVELSNLVETEVVPALRGVHGVGYVNVSGEFIREIHVQPDLARLQMLGATPVDVVNSVGQGNVSMPGGRLDEAFREATVGIRADITDPAQIAQLPLVVPNASPNQIKIGDVANVLDTYQDHRLASEVNGQPAIVLSVAHDSDADTQRTTQAIRAAFAQLTEKYPDVRFQELSADEDFLHEAVDGVMSNLFEGVLLTALVLLLFLHVIRSAAVVMIAIPTSILATFLVMWLLGFSIDLLSLMGLSLTIGILVDDSIVVIENITRHREMGKPPEEAAIVGRTEIGGAAIAITLVDVVVFTPIAFMGGIVGQFLREYGLVIVTATLFSLLVSFTLTPLLSAHWALLRRPKQTTFSSRGIAITLVVVGIVSLLGIAARIAGLLSGPLLVALLMLTFTVALLALLYNHFNAWFEALRRWYHDTLLPNALRHPYLVGFGSLGLVLASIVVAAILVPTEFTPDTEYGSASASITYPVGTPIAVTTAGAERMAAILRKRDDVREVVVNVGADTNDVNGGYVANLQVNLKPERRHDQHLVVDQMRHMESVVPGAYINAGGEGGAQMIYTLLGPPDKLYEAADKLVAYIKKIPNTIDVVATSEIVGPRLEIDIDRARAATLGVSPQAIALTARASVGGVIATKMRSNEGLVNTIVQLPPGTRNDFRNLTYVPVRAQDGVTLVPMADVAHFRWVTEPPTLRREDRQRIVRVFSDTVNGAPIGPIDSKVQAVLRQPGFLPAGVQVLAEGDTQFLGDTMNKIGIALVTSFMLIYMLLVILYRSYLEPFIIMLSIPLALVGALGILVVCNLIHMVAPDLRWFAGQTLNIFSMLGIVMLMGLVAKNGILLVDYANTLHARGLSLLDSVAESAAIRFRPIMMTTAAMIVGMTPLALGFTEGAEFRKSMGTVIIGGLTSSLLLTLFLVPVMYVVIVGAVERYRQRQLSKRLVLAADEDEAVGSPLNAPGS